MTVRIEADDTMADLTAVWALAEHWDRERPQSVELADCRAQLYMGAMEIPLVVFRPRPHVQLPDDRLQAWRPALASLGLMLELVEIGRNYKINRRDTNEYIARILPDALKLHCERILDLGSDVFESLTKFYLALPRVP